MLVWDTLYLICLEIGDKEKSFKTLAAGEKKRSSFSKLILHKRREEKKMCQISN
jgi:hypothetical protein